MCTPETYIMLPRFKKIKWGVGGDGKLGGDRLTSLEWHSEAVILGVGLSGSGDSGGRPSPACGPEAVSEGEFPDSVVLLAWEEDNLL